MDGGFRDISTSSFLVRDASKLYAEARIPLSLFAMSCRVKSNAYTLLFLLPASLRILCP